MNQNINHRLNALPNPSPRKLTLFACACIREIWHLLQDNRSKEGIIAAENYVEGLISKEDLRKTNVAAEAAWADADRHIPHVSMAALAAYCVNSYAIAYINSTFFYITLASSNKEHTFIKHNQLFDDIFGE